jgi:hypothetical protein
VRFVAAVLAFASFGFADTITFRDGHTVTGSFLGGDSRTVRVAVGDRVENFSISDITTITFGDAQTIAPPVLRDNSTSTRPAPPRDRLEQRPAGASAATPAAPARRDENRPVVPAGTTLTVRMVDSVDSERDSVGQTYRASLDEPVLDSEGRTLIARGADVKVKLVDDQQSGKIEGKTVLTLDIVSVNVNGRDVDVDTSAITEESSSRTARSGKVIGGTAALGAIIGALAGGGKGAAIGAASGAGVGTAAQVATKGQRVRIPSETRLTFTLQQPLRL